jgi:hypothetical protein
MNVFGHFLGDFKPFLPSQRGNFSQQHSIGGLSNFLIKQNKTPVSNRGLFVARVSQLGRAGHSRTYGIFQEKSNFVTG